MFDDVWETIDERYYDPTFRGIDWNKRRVVYRPLASDAGSPAEFYEILRRMIAPLRDAHTRVYSPEEKFDWWQPRFITVGLSVRDIEGSPTVVHVDPGSAADKARIRAGDVIVKIDHVPASEVLAQRFRTTGADEPRAKLRITSGLFDGPAGSSVEIEWQNRAGELKATKLDRSWNERKLGYEIKRKNNIAVVIVDVFTPPVAAELVRILPPLLQHAHALVLDLRANGGGDAEAMAEVASLFLKSGTDLGKFTDRSGGSFELHTNLRLSALGSKVFEAMPVAILTSERTSSAAEILVWALRTERGARVLGTQTCGCVLAIRNRHELPDGGVLDVSELDYQTARGIHLEGIGITPDEIIPNKRRDIYSQRDVALDRALAFLRSSSAK